MTSQQGQGHLTLTSACLTGVIVPTPVEIILLFLFTFSFFLQQLSLKVLEDGIVDISSIRMLIITCIYHKHSIATTPRTNTRGEELLQGAEEGE